MKRVYQCLSAALLLVIVIGLALVSPAHTPVAATAGSATNVTDRVVAVFDYSDQAALDAVAGQLDIWEVHRDASYAVAAVSPDQFQWLTDLGYKPRVDQTKTEQLRTEAVLDPRYHYYDAYYMNPNGLYVTNFMQETNYAYPALTELLDAGDAWQGLHMGYHRDIWILRITNEDPAYGAIADKPAFFLHAQVHAREVATPELAIRYVKLLTSGFEGLGGYGVDPDVTWLVDHNVAYILVMANPDGHVPNEQNTGNYRRKNMDNDDGCTDPSSLGVDLNRNHSFKWGCCGGSSGSPCADTYRGPLKGSEPETQGFQSFFGSVMLDQNGNNGDDEIPRLASGYHRHASLPCIATQTRFSGLGGSSRAGHRTQPSCRISGASSPTTTALLPPSFSTRLMAIPMTGPTASTESHPSSSRSAPTMGAAPTSSLHLAASTASTGCRAISGPSSAPRSSTCTRSRIPPT